LKNDRRSIAGRVVFSVVVLAVALGIFIYRQELIDQLNFWQYRPSEQVSAITERAELNDRGKFYFYTSRPEIQEREAFNGSCNTQRGETTVVLGCYVTQRIYLFNVADPKLDGIKEVTAAHEMLHAVYERLSAQERERINDLLQTEAEKITDAGFIELMKAYEASEPGERMNELHSIIGTQVATLSPELESYYARYFKDRSALAKLYAKYEGVFTDLKNRQTQLANELNALVEQINQATADYNKAVQELNVDVMAFNAKADSGGFASQAQFNVERNALIDRQQKIGKDRTEIDGFIATYNTKRQQLTEINSQAEALNHSINSNLSPLPSI